MSTPAPRSRHNTRARLLDAAAQVFAEVGLEGASVEAICERAGFTRGAFYSNFASKDELFLELATRVAVDRLDAVRERVRDMTDADSLSDACSVSQLVRHVMDVGSDDRLGVMLHSEIRIRALRDPEFGLAYTELEEQLVDGIARIIEDVTALGHLSLRMDAREAARVLQIVWEGTTVRGAMRGLEAEELRRRAGDALSAVVDALLRRD